MFLRTYFFQDYVIRSKNVKFGRAQFTGIYLIFIATYFFTYCE